jgi:hypothetical protein
MTDHLQTLDLSQVYLEIDETTQQRAWQQSQTLATPASRWRAYLNQLALDAVIPWLATESGYGRALPSPKSALLPTIWELVTGAAVEVGPLRFVILPTETIDLEAMAIPQEWLDIPQWVGDYYLTLQVNVDEGWLRVSQFATHAQIKARANYDWRDRTYHLDASNAIGDLNVLWVSHDLYPEDVKRSAVAPLPALSQAQAQNLIQRLGQADATPLPRLAIPSDQWGALMAHGGWRRQLAETRWGRPTQGLVGDWISAQIDRLSQQVGWQSVVFQAATAGARSSATAAPSTALVRQITLAGGEYLLQIYPLPDQGDRAWRFELRSALPAGQVPAGFSLTLLTEDLQAFEGNTVTAPEATESLSIDLDLAPGEGIVWQTDPVSEQYDAEILWF